eukprot:jgi/Ulvmu1/2724/UM014_0181.1
MQRTAPVWKLSRPHHVCPFAWRKSAGRGRHVERTKAPAAVAGLEVTASGSSTGCPTSTTVAASLDVLEWPSICRQLASFCQTTMGASVCLECSVPIYTSIAGCKTLQDETLEALQVDINMDGIPDLQPLLQLISNEARPAVQEQRMVLQVVQLATVSNTIDKMMRVRTSVLSQACPALGAHAVGISDGLHAVLNSLQHAIDAKTAVVLDRSSSALTDIRAKKQQNSKQLQQQIDQFCRLLHQQGASDLKAPVMRRDRLCCSVKRGRSGILPKGSITLATSQTGSTLYMEPKPVIELNNALSELRAAEEAEELAVLTELTRMLAQHRTVLEDAFYAIARIDLASARARHAKWLRGSRPLLLSIDSHDAIVDLAGVRHPLLLQNCLETLSDPPTDEGAMFSASVEASCQGTHAKHSQCDAAAPVTASWPEPLDLTVPAGVQVVALTGANTGGKTSCLKALGISVLMAQAGMWIHCDPNMRPTSDDGQKINPKVAVFENILADLGDNQSLQQSLSTFSGHMKQVKAILNASGPGSLVLLDELGSGTDPCEGAALAIAVLRRLSEDAALTFMTTHYTELKEEAAQNPAFINAAVEFDLETLKPTFKLSWGAEGASNALSVAHQLGFDRDVLARGHKWVDRLTCLTQSKSKASSVAAEITNQIEVGQRQRVDSGNLQRAAEERVSTLEALLSTAELQARALYSQAKHVTEDATKEARKLQHLEDKVSRGQLVASEALKQLEQALSKLPAVEDAQRRLLGLRMGGSVEPLTASITEPRQESPTGGAESWIPQAGEEVLVMKMGGATGIVLERPSSQRGNTQVQVDMGGLRISAKLASLRRSSQPRRGQQPVVQKRRQGRRAKDHSRLDRVGVSAGSGEKERAGVSLQVSANTIDVRGQRTNIALMHVEQHLPEKSASGVVFIVHGVGTGALRSEIHRFLRADPQVKRFELEAHSNGGCTVVYF